MGNGDIYRGKVKSVGKASGKYKNQCVVDVDGVERNYDFPEEVEHWKYTDNPHVNFETVAKYHEDDSVKDVMVSDIGENDEETCSKE